MVLVVVLLVEVALLLLGKIYNKVFIFLDLSVILFGWILKK